MSLASFSAHIHEFYPFYIVARRLCILRIWLNGGEVRRSWCESRLRKIEWLGGNGAVRSTFVAILFIDDRFRVIRLRQLCPGYANLLGCFDSKPYRFSLHFDDGQGDVAANFDLFVKFSGEN